MLMFVITRGVVEACLPRPVLIAILFIHFFFLILFKNFWIAKKSHFHPWLLPCLSVCLSIYDFRSLDSDIHDNSGIEHRRKLVLVPNFCIWLDFELSSFITSGSNIQKKYFFFKIIKVKCTFLKVYFTIYVYGKSVKSSPWRHMQT